MSCILKAVITWIILLLASGGINSFLRRGLFGLLVPFPEASTNPLVEEALRGTRKSFMRAHIANTIFSFAVTVAYLWALFHFWNIGLAATGVVMLIVIMIHFAKTPPFVSFAADAVLWGSSVLVWYSLCRWT